MYVIEYVGIGARLVPMITGREESYDPVGILMY